MNRIGAAAAALALCAQAEAQSRNPLDALRLEDLSATRERPLFRTTRRAQETVPLAAPTPDAPVPETPVAAAERPPYELIGVAVGGAIQIALLRDKTTGEVLRLRPGEEAAGWRVTSIDRRELTLTRDGRTEALALTTTSGAETAGEPSRRSPAEALAATITALPPRSPPPD